MLSKQRISYKDLDNLTIEQIKDLLDNDVFNIVSFNKHIVEVSLKTKINEKIVEQVLKSYFTNILIVINTIRKIKTKINVYGFFSIIIEKGKRI